MEKYRTSYIKPRASEGTGDGNERRMLWKERSCHKRVSNGPILHGEKDNLQSIPGCAAEIDTPLGPGAYRHTGDPCGKGEGFFCDELFQHTGP